MNARFKRLIRIAMKWEGENFTDIPEDKGGATRFGITQDLLSWQKGFRVSKDAVKNLTRAEAELIYHNYHWTTIWGDRIIDDGVCVFLLDCAINHGPGNAAFMSQDILSDVTVDNAFGPQTVGAINASKAGDFLESLINRRQQFYDAIVANNPSQNKFYNGWMNRLDDIAKISRGMVKEKVQPHPPIIVHNTNFNKEPTKNDRGTRLAVVVGHNSKAQGAIRVDTGETEYIFNGKIAQVMERLAPQYGIDLRVFRRTSGGSYRTEIHRVYDQVDAWNPSASIELHFNSASASATGTETLSSGSALSLRLAAEVQNEMVITLGLDDRGIKTVTGHERGRQSLIAGRAPAILVEPFFGSSISDGASIDEQSEIEALAHAYLRGSAVALDGFPRRNLEDSRTLVAANNQRKAAAAGSTAIAGSVVAEVSEAVVGDVGSITEAATILQPIAQFLPWASGVLAILGIGLFIYSRLQTERIEQARVDDHEREIR